MACLVLNFGKQYCLTFQRRRPGDPVAFRQHANNFAMSMLADLPDERLTVFLRHPILWLDLYFIFYFFLEFLGFLLEHNWVFQVQIYELMPEPYTIYHLVKFGSFFK